MGEYDATPRPDVAPPTRWEFPLPTTTMLDNGLTVHTYHLPLLYNLSFLHIELG